MKRVGGLAAVVGLVLGVAVMREATENRADEMRPGSTTTVDFEVETRRYGPGEEAAAVALWSVCAGTISGTTWSMPEPVDGHWQVHITPAIGEHGENRLVGCIEDVTIDRVRGDVLALHFRE